jgi:hypothetical protein
MLEGLPSAVKGHTNAHRIWMMRSFGITLEAVSARVLVPVLLITYYTFNGSMLPEGRDKMIEEVLNVNIWAGFSTLS